MSSQRRETELLHLGLIQQRIWAKAVAGDAGTVGAALKVVDRKMQLLGLGWSSPERTAA